HGDVEAILRDPATFSSDTARLVPAAAPVRRGMLTQIDPPEHRALRRLVSATFTPRTVAGLEPRIRSLTGELLGLPADDRPLFRTWADGLFNMQVGDPNDPELGPQVAAAMSEIIDYFLRACRARRAEPRDDLISALVTTEAEGRVLDDEEAANFSMLLLLAGHITTTVLLGNAVRTFDENPGVWAELRAEPALIPGAIEEVLRLRSPFVQVGRATVRAVDVGGVEIPADVLVLPWLLSANHDPAAHREPERFDLRRGLGGGAQLAFGHGVHFCLGAPLARLEGRVAL